MIQHQRRVGGHVLHLRALIVQHTQWVDFRAASGFLVQRQGKQKLLKLLSVGGSAGAVAQAGNFQTVPGQAH